jgi:hypothetical protein
VCSCTITAADTLVPPSPPRYPPTPCDRIMSSDSLEDFSQFQDEKEDSGVVLSHPLPSLNSSLDLSGEHSGRDDHSGLGMAMGMERSAQSVLHSPAGFTSDGSSGFTPPAISTRPRSTRPQALSAQLCSQFRGCLSGHDSENDDHAPPVLPPRAKKNTPSVGFSHTDLEYQYGTSPEYPPVGNGNGNGYGKKLKRSLTLPNGRGPPQTPEMSKALSQSNVPGGGGNNHSCTAAAPVHFTTPLGAVSQHTSGRPGYYDFLQTEEAFEFELSKFEAVFHMKEAKPAKRPVVRESMSPYLFSAMSNRHLSDSGGSYTGDAFGSDEKQLAKEKKNKAFLKRMSSGGHDACKGSSFNPSTASKVKRDRKSIISNQASVVNRESKVHWYDLQGGHSCLDHSSFRGMIVGGTYENCFDDNVPVVTAPTAREKRVVGVQLVPSTHSGTAACLKVFLFMASSRDEKQIKSVNLGHHWVCYKISTGGFLVSRAEIMPYQSCTCYFMPKHPKKWTQMMNNMSPKHSRYGLASLGANTSPKSFTDASIVDCDTFHDELEHTGSRDESNRIISSIDHFAADESQIFQDDEDMQDDDHEQYVDDQHTRALCRQLHVSPITSDNSSLGCGLAGGLPKLRFSSHDEDDEEEEGEEEEEEDESVFCMQQATQDTDADGVVFVHLDATDDEDDALDMSINALRLDDDEDDYDDDDDDETTTIGESNEDWNHSVVVSNIMTFLLDAASPSSNIMGDISVVSKSWALECYKLRAANLSQPGACQRLDGTGWVRFMSQYGEGKFLSAGACKDVFCVHAQPAPVSGLVMDEETNKDNSSRLQAVSVMDMIDLQDRGVADSISRELEISMLCSSLVSLNICPNLPQVYSIFQSQYPPSNSLWKRGKGTAFPSAHPNISTSKVSQALGKLSVGEYQYIRMEFCSSGDLEEVVRSRKHFNAVEVRSMLFQMCFALYACREQLSMRHYDVKLLNFFSTGADSLLSSAGSKEEQQEEEAEEDSGMHLDSTDPSSECSLQYVHVGFGEHIYSLPLGGASCSASQSMVKLADFGTSSVGSGTLSLPITVHQVMRRVSVHMTE